MNPDPLAPQTLDPLGRTPISNWMKARIDAELGTLPADRRAAVVLLADTQGTTAHFAARLDDGHFKVAGGLGWTWDSPKPSGFVGVVMEW